MGFECPSETGWREGRGAESGVSVVGMVEEAGSERGEELQRRLFRQGEDTNALVCRSTSSRRGGWTGQEESKYMHADSSAAVNL